MHFTREPVIETIITPKEGYKLLVRNTHGSSHEEFFVDALQVIVIGQSCFYRSLEKPKAFFVPATDYEVLEVKETRVSLKMPSKDTTGGIKIAGGRQASVKSRETPRQEKERIAKEKEVPIEGGQEAVEPKREGEPQEGMERQQRRRRFRKRHKEEGGVAVETTAAAANVQEEAVSLPGGMPYIIPPPSTLISESISRYKQRPDFAGAFYEKEGEQKAEERTEASEGSLMESVEEIEVGLISEPSEGSLLPLEESDEEGRDFL